MKSDQLQKLLNDITARLQKLNPAATILDARALRRAAMALHRWYEHECNGTIQRDETSGIPYWHSPVSYKKTGRASDRETGAQKQIKRVCDKLGMHHYLQTDPRGGTLYVDTKPIPENNYNRATFIA